MHKNNDCLNFLFMSGETPINRVEAKLKELRWSWAEFARRVGETSQTVNNWRKRGIPEGQYYPVAKAIGITVECLVEGSGPKVPMKKQGALPSGAQKERGKEAVYPEEPFNRLSKLAKLWPHLTDETQDDILDKIEHLVNTTRHGREPPTPHHLKRESVKSKK